MEKYAWITLIATNDFIPGAINLNKSLKKVKSKYPLLVIATNNIIKENLDLLESFGIEYRRFPYLSFVGDAPIEGKSWSLVEGDGDYRYWHCTMSKFYTFTFVDYDKVAFVDADILFRKNCDSYFTDYELPAAYIQPWDVTEHVIHGSIWVVKPSYETFWEAIRIGTDNHFQEDQSVLHTLYKDFYLWNEKHHLPQEDVWTKDTETRQRILHYDGPVKYWMDENENKRVLELVGIS